MCPGMSLPVGGAHSAVNATVSVVYCVMTALGHLVTALANDRHGEPVHVVVRAHAKTALGGQHPLLCCLKKESRAPAQCLRRSAAPSWPPTPLLLSGITRLPSHHIETVLAVTEAAKAPGTTLLKKPLHLMLN